MPRSCLCLLYSGGPHQRLQLSMLTHRKHVHALYIIQSCPADVSICCDGKCNNLLLLYIEQGKTFLKMLANINYWYIMSGDQVMTYCGCACLFYSIYRYRHMIINNIPPSLDVVSMSSYVGIFFFCVSLSSKLLSHFKFFVILKTFHG